MSAVPVLCYHAIGGPTSGPDHSFSVEPQTFADHLDALDSEGWRFAPFSDLIKARAAGGDLAAKTAVVTFDDGFASVLHSAVPILHGVGATGTAFITTGFLASEKTLAPDRYLTQREVEQLSAAGLEIGAHGDQHLEHDLIGPDELHTELARSQEILRDIVGQEILSYAYPFGYSNPEVQAAAANEGYRGAAGVRHALSSAADSPFDIARLRITRRTTPERLMGWVSGRDVRTSPCPERLVSRAYRRVRSARKRVQRPIGR